MPFAIHLRALWPRSSISCEEKSFEIDRVCEPRQPSVKNNSWWTVVRWECGAIFKTASQKKVLHLQSDAFLTLERQPFYRTLMLSVWVCQCFFPPTEYDAYAVQTKAHIWSGLCIVVSIYLQTQLALFVIEKWRICCVCFSTFIVKFWRF